MTEEESVPVTVRILDKEYRVACQPHQQEALIQSAHFLDQRMREIRQSGRVIGIDRIAVMAALNISHELLQLERQHQGLAQETEQRLFALQMRIQEALARQGQLDSRTESE